jgi:hypothetical protein
MKLLCKKNYKFVRIVKKSYMKLNLNIIKVVLGIIIIILAYLLYESILEPLRFDKALRARESVVISRLIDLRNSEQLYKQLNGKYMANFDTLLTFLRTSDIPIVKKVADPNDTTFTKTIIDTVGFVKVADSLFGKRPKFSLDSLQYIPFTNGQKFDIQSGTIERGGVVVPVFEISAKYEVFLKGLDRQLVINHIKSQKDLNRFAGLKVGSMEEPSTDGNWE